MSPVAGSVPRTPRWLRHTHLDTRAFICREDFEGYLSRRLADLGPFPRREATRTLDLLPVKLELLPVLRCGDFECGERVQQVDRGAKDPIIDLCQGCVLVSNEVFKCRPRRLEDCLVRNMSIPWPQGEMGERPKRSLMPAETFPTSLSFPWLPSTSIFTILFSSPSRRKE